MPGCKQTVTFRTEKRGLKKKRKVVSIFLQSDRERGKSIHRFHFFFSLSPSHYLFFSLSWKKKKAKNRPESKSCSTMVEIERKNSIREHRISILWHLWTKSKEVEVNILLLLAAETVTFTIPKAWNDNQSLSLLLLLLKEAFKERFHRCVLCSRPILCIYGFACVNEKKRMGRVLRREKIMVNFFPCVFAATVAAWREEKKFFSSDRGRGRRKSLVTWLLLLLLSPL